MMNPDTIASNWLHKLNSAFSAKDSLQVAECFENDGIWRDHLSFTGTLKSVEGHNDIVSMTKSSGFQAGLIQFHLTGETIERDGVLQGELIFDTAVGRCKGYYRLRDGKCWTLYTCLRELKGFEETIGPRRPTGAESLGTNWKDRLSAEKEAMGRDIQPYVLIIGGGQGGLALGARLKMLNVPALIIDRFPRIGDQWRARYKSLTLHDPVWYDHMPYLPFPENWPVFTPKDKMGDWLEYYAGIMELNVWNNTEFSGASYDDETVTWDVILRDTDGERHVRPKHLVIATGNAGWAYTPSFSGQDKFKGRQFHSTKYSGGEEFKGKNVVVIGSNNSAHDICADLAEQNANVTMIQRSPTWVWRQETLIKAALGELYSEQALAIGITTERADFMMASLPLRLLAQIEPPMAQKIMKQDAAFYDSLEKVGFMLPEGDDRNIMMSKALAASSGYYINVGASEMIVSGQIKLKSRVGVDHLDENGVFLSDGSYLPADVVVYATGFESMDRWIADVLSPEIAQKIGKCWGYGSGMERDPGPWVGEIRNMWKPTAQSGLWFQGGNLSQTRYYSLLLALQIKARYEGLSLVQ